MQKGKLFIVPTPIGNLEDITFRAIKVLKGVDEIAAEDTRTSSILLKHYEISTPLTSLHQHNEHQKVDFLLQKILSGKNIAVITDAGTPGISDPGYFIVHQAIEKEIEVECLPGATAFVPALVASGLPCDRFIFEGFLPVKKGRLTKFQELKDEQRTIIFYESPFRILKTLQEILEYWGDCKTVVVRELSKKFETYHRGFCSELVAYFSQKEPKGECILLVNQNIKKNRPIQ
ncbi:MAG: ribosomal RNA small subunit methyltransferase I [Bacteroidia bacterium]|nr:MAG: ribosomal RNA small subunit methyltransferase I [Bacteroidia bacterium]